MYFIRYWTGHYVPTNLSRNESPKYWDNAWRKGKMWMPSTVIHLPHRNLWIWNTAIMCVSTGFTIRISWFRQTAIRIRSLPAGSPSSSTRGKELILTSICISSRRIRSSSVWDSRSVSTAPKSRMPQIPIQTLTIWIPRSVPAISWRLDLPIMRISTTWTCSSPLRRQIWRNCSGGFRRWRNY